MLRARLADLPSVTCLFGRSAQTFEQDDNGVRVSVVDEGWPYEDQVLEADYIVGCDGARSSVREQLGIDRDGADFDQRMVLAVLRSRQLHEGLKRFPERTTYRVLHPDLSGVWQFFGRVDVGEGFFFHAPVPRDTTAENYDFHGLVQQAAGFSFPATFDHIGFWELRILAARRYRGGRAFIAGDASHSHPPYGAHGLNSGLEDVANLGWKLAASLEGWGGEVLLDSFSLERQPIFAETGEDMIADGIRRDRQFLARFSPDRDRQEFEQAWSQLGSGGFERERQWEYEPHYEGSSVVEGPPGAACSIHGSFSVVARPGHHLTPQPLSTGRNVFEELDAGFTLLAFGADDKAVGAIQQTAGSQRLPLKVVRDSYDGGRQEYGSRLILVRPDQYVAWMGDEAPRDVSRLLRKVAGLA